MQIQTVFRAGNSNVVAIPTDLGKEVGLKVGQRVILEKSPSGNEIVIKKEAKHKSPNTATSKEFQKWLKGVLKEDGEILDELAQH